MSGTLDGKVLVVTGATSGIGKALARACAAEGATIVMVGRDSPRAQEALKEVRESAKGGRVELIPADLLALAEIRRLAGEISNRFGKVHVLVNNAGAVFFERAQSKDGLEATFALDVVAPFVLTQELLGALQAGAPSRVINVVTKIPPGTSIHLDDLQSEHRYSGFRAYSQAKLELMALTAAMQRHLGAQGITFHSVHPGIVLGTGFGQGGGWLMQRAGPAIARMFSLNTPMDEAIANLMQVMTSPEATSHPGEYFVAGKPHPYPKPAMDPNVQEGLWKALESIPVG